MSLTMLENHFKAYFFCCLPTLSSPLPLLIFCCFLCLFIWFEIWSIFILEKILLSLLYIAKSALKRGEFILLNVSVAFRHCFTKPCTWFHGVSGREVGGRFWPVALVPNILSVVDLFCWESMRHMSVVFFFKEVLCGSRTLASWPSSAGTQSTVPTRSISVR